MPEDYSARAHLKGTPVWKLSSAAAIPEELRWTSSTSILPRFCSPIFPKREREIVSAIIAGSTNKDIAASLSLSEDTVKHHLSNIFDKARVSNRLELAVWAIKQEKV
jgi:DNA-binding NarL/FixJ family response regulator